MMYETKTRNFWITVIAMALAFAAWCLAGAFGWDGVEWIVGTILGVKGFSSLRALGDYRRTDITPAVETDTSENVESVEAEPYVSDAVGNGDQLTVP